MTHSDLTGLVVELLTDAGYLNLAVSRDDGTTLSGQWWDDDEGDGVGPEVTVRWADVKRVREW